MYQPRPTKVNKKFVPIPQVSFPKGYISTLANSRLPLDGLAKMQNYWLEQDSVPRPRPPFIPYGSAFVGTCIGIAPYTKFLVGMSGPEYHEISMQVIPVNAVQTLSITGSPTGGTFTLTFGGHTTTGIAYNAAASAVQSALVALSSIGAGNVVCSGGNLPGTPVVITFQGALANTNVALITANSAGLTGGSTPTASVANTTTGGPSAGLYTRKDGGNWSLVTSGAPVYNTVAWVNFCQGAAVGTGGTEDARVYVSNGQDVMSYYDINSNAIVVYTGLTTPSAPTVTPTGLTGTNFTQYYRITANNAGGESAASAAGSSTIQVARDFWTTGESISVSWSPVSGATSYSIYTSDESGQEAFLATVAGTTFVDDGSISIDVFKLAPFADSSAGPKVSVMINMDNQLFATGDLANPSYLWYSGQAQHFGDFSFNPQGGGYVGIDYGGDTIPTVPFSFQDGKGNPVLSILTYGQVGRGKLMHLTFIQETVGTTQLSIPNVYEASSKDGTPATRGVALYNNNAYYCTGVAFKTTGIKPNVINILSTDTISNQLLPDLARLNLAALTKSVAQEFLGKIYFAVPVDGSTANNEIWVLDLTRGGLWILAWPVSVQHMWLYQDNNGVPHFMTLQNNMVLELDISRTAIPHQDNGVPFTSILRSGAMVFDKGGIGMFASYITYFKFLQPTGTIVVNIYGITDENLSEQLLQTDTLQANSSSSRVGWGQMMFSNPAANTPMTWSGNVGRISQTALGVEPLALEVDQNVNQQTWEIVMDTAGSDALVSSVTTTGWTIPRLYLGQ